MSTVEQAGGPADQPLAWRQGEGIVFSDPLPDDLVVLIAERFRVLSEPTRIKLLHRLRVGEASVLDLSEAIGTTQQNVSKHLGVLHRAGIVARRKQGNFVYYSSADANIYGLCETVCGSLEQQAESLRRVVAGAGAN
jgi:DNA-binding transcriptional ArsR family regulator